MESFKHSHRMTSCKSFGAMETFREAGGVCFQIKLFKHLLSLTVPETLLGLARATRCLCTTAPAATPSGRCLPLGEGKTTFGNKARAQRQVLHWTSPPPSQAPAPVASSLGCKPQAPSHTGHLFRPQERDPKEDQVLPSDPKGNCTDNKDRERSKWNYNPRGPSAPSPPCRGSGPPRPPLLLQCEGLASCLTVVRPGCRFSGPRGSPPAARGFAISAPRLQCFYQRVQNLSRPGVTRGMQTISRARPPGPG